MSSKRILLLCLFTFAMLATAASAEKIPYAQSKIVPPTPEWTASRRKSLSPRELCHAHP